MKGVEPSAFRYSFACHGLRGGANDHRITSPERADLAEDRDSTYGTAADHEHAAADQQHDAQHADYSRSQRTRGRDCAGRVAAPLATVGPAASQGQSHGKRVAGRPARTQEKTQTRVRPRTS